jgi:hypothetical protein
MKPKPSEYQHISIAGARLLNRIWIIIAVNVEYSKFSILFPKMKSKPSEYQQISVVVTRVLNRIWIIIAVNVEYSKFSILLVTIN